MPGSLEVSKYLGAQMYRGRNAEKENLSRIFADSKWLVLGGGVGRMRKYSHLGICCHLKACSVRQGWDRLRLIAAPMYLMTSCGGKLMARQGESPLSVDFVSSSPL